MQYRSLLLVGFVALFTLTGCQSPLRFQPKPIPQDAGPSAIEYFRSASSYWMVKDGASTTLDALPAYEFEAETARLKSEKEILDDKIKKNAARLKDATAGYTSKRKDFANKVNPSQEEQQKAADEIAKAVAEIDAAKLEASQLMVAKAKLDAEQELLKARQSGNARVQKWRESDATPQQKRDFLKAGLNLSDYYADDWLKSEFLRETKSKFWKNSFNTAASLTTAVLGFTSAGGHAVTAVGASGAAINAEWNNYEASYILSTTMPKVIKKLKEYRESLRKKLEEDFDPETMSYADTRAWIDSYHATISRESVKNFIETSVDLVDATVKNPTEEALKAPEVKVANRELYSLLYGKAGEFSDSQLLQLYAEAYHSDDAKKDPSPASASLRTAYEGKKNDANRIIDQLNTSLNFEAKYQARQAAKARENAQKAEQEKAEAERVAMDKKKEADAAKTALDAAQTKLRHLQNASPSDPAKISEAKAAVDELNRKFEELTKDEKAASARAATAAETVRNTRQTATSRIVDLDHTVKPEKREKPSFSPQIRANTTK